MVEKRMVADLAAFARKHHVHFEVEPDVLVRANDRVKVGFEARLRAVHPRGSRALPGCEKCRDLVSGLRRLAEWAIPSERRPTLIEIEPFHPALYDSREVSGADEVSLSIRLATARAGTSTSTRAKSAVWRTSDNGFGPSAPGNGQYTQQLFGTRPGAALADDRRRADNEIVTALITE